MMQWHIVCRLGAEDGYTPTIGAGEPRVLAPIDQPGNAREVASAVLRPFCDRTGLLVPRQARDLLTLALAVYAADLRVPRKHAHDRWTRDLVLHLPVLDQRQWKRATPTMNRALEFLTGDRWQLRLRQHHEAGAQLPVQRELVERPDIVTLFSGGLDSVVGAIDRLHAGARVALVGHYGAGITHATQNAVVKPIRDAYENAVSSHLFYVQPPRIDGHEGEPSMRSRSLLFLALGVAVASAFGEGIALQIAENGVISLNVPLTNPRMGSLSTRTTHPYFIRMFREVLRKLRIPISLDLPYRFQTKGEMLRDAANQTLLRAVTPLTMSCSHAEAGRFLGLSPDLPCGYCVPCLIRRAAVAAAGLDDRPYRVDILTSPPPADSVAGRDLRAFQMAIVRMENETPAAQRFRVLQSGRLPPAEFLQYSAAYLRGFAEVKAFLESGAHSHEQD